MTQAIFRELLEQLCMHPEWQAITMQQALPIDTWLAVALLKVATPTGLHYIGHLFGVGKATTGEAVLEVFSVLLDMLGNTMLQVQDPLGVVAGSHTLDFSQCTEALDGTQHPHHLPAPQ